MQGKEVHMTGMELTKINKISIIHKLDDDLYEVHPV